MRILTILAVLLVAGLANLAVWWLPNRPVPLEAPPGGKLTSVSFAPFRDGQSPLTKSFPTPAQIDEDLAAIAPQVAGVRTYTSGEGLEVVPELARKHGLKVTMGAWLSSELDRNELEVTALIDLANRYPDVITRVIVGNEVLLRRELTADQVAGYIDRVKAAVKQPVSYADVWEWWLKYPQIADHVDYLTIHLLPYWEDVPASVAGAQERIRTSYRIIAQRFPGKPILVGETGWPTAGRSRGAAVTGLVEKATFVNGFVRLAQQEGFDYNVIEAFDQNWKQKLEGTVGGHWGLYSVDRQAKFSLAGPVVENPQWPTLFAAATGLGLALFAVVGRAAAGLSTGGTALLAALGLGLGSAFVRALDRALHWNYYWQDVTLGYAMLAAEAVLAVALTAAVHRTLAARGPERGPLLPVGAFAGAGGLERAGAVAALALAGLAAVWSILIIVDGRYRDFPNPDMVIPAVGLLVLGAARAVRRPDGTAPVAAFAAGSLFTAAVPAGTPSGRLRVEAVLAALLLAGAAGTVIAEGFVPLESLIYGQLPFMEALHEVDWSQPNLEALSWAALQLLLALPFAAALATARGRVPAASGKPVHAVGK
ncbi:glycoside hydrolase [Azospirillum sp. RWY-5-1]|uniref:Endo-1,3-beta-glucanase btgC n=1 Tax=Azospirillum oleiclasticum TaxID=2735135 RepID=A0ABX2T7E8_9PROT|nr:glycosyl hydrolase family 17 protein [Azospirillum oleiclasticum]NYZ13203.1 glycoside hydrolase [Azospirillum oleiclasticum]NYZ20124.1 glycoside hydrolase [Azospirillum oleiclasticum]